MNFAGHNIDTSQHTGGGNEHTSAWSHWSQVHMREMRVLHEAGILGLENRDWRNVAEHSMVVNATAVFIARKLAEAGQDIDVALVDEASMLHDATKRLEKENGISYGNEHESSVREEFLGKQGYSPEVIATTEYTGRVSEIFIDDPAERRAAVEAVPLAQLVVAYSDARVRNTNIVPLEQARDMNKQKVPADAAIYDQWYDFYHDAETRIFTAMQDPGMTPDMLNDTSVTDMVQQDYELAGY